MKLLLEIAQKFVDNISLEGRKLLQILRADKESLPNYVSPEKKTEEPKTEPSFFAQLVSSATSVKKEEKNNDHDNNIPKLKKNVYDTSTVDGLNSYVKEFMNSSIQIVKNEIKDLKIRLNAAKWVLEKLNQNPTKEICKAIVEHIKSKIECLKKKEKEEKLKSKSLKRKFFEDEQDPELLEFSNSQVYDEYDIDSSCSDE